ncbi:MAG: acyltransferase [Armatimonadetes bacterium]|nr:acyltransferase [Armatimonadota bacterium]
MTRHLRGFDYLRLIAVFAVVWIHGSDTNTLAKQGGNLLTGFAVPSFLMMSVYLTLSSLQRTPERGFVAFMRRRLVRLGPAYLLWTGVYLLFRLAKHALVLQQPFAVDWVPTLLCGAAANHLWYVPALIYLTALFFPLFKAAQGSRGPALAVPCLLLAAGGVAVYQLLASCATVPLTVPSFLLHYLLRCGGCVPLAAALWLMTRPDRAWLRPTSGVQVPLLAGGAWAAAVALMWVPQADTVVVYLLALGAVLLALSWPRTEGPGSPWLAEVSAVTFGVYLMHGVFVEGLQVAASVAHVDLSSLVATLGVIVMSFGLSILFSVLLGRIKACRWMVRVG